MPAFYPFQNRYWLFSGLLVAIWAEPGLAQEAIRVESIQVSPAAAAQPAKAAESQSGKSADPVKRGGDEKQPADAAKSEKQPTDAKGENQNSDQEAKPVERPKAEAEPANREEQRLSLDEQETVRFNFRKAPWTWVLEELAGVSGMSLDWQELPGDSVDLVTTQRYSVADAADLINRLLLARGYTILRQGETLSVVNVKKLDRGLIPRVRPEDLADRQPNEFVKVSFPLDWMLAESAVEELKPMLSPNGQLTALKSTNRLEAVDAVVNLRELYTVLKEEQRNEGEERLIRAFAFEHIRARDAVEQLYAILGIEKKSGPEQPMSPQQLQMQMQLAQMQAKNPNAVPAKEPVEVHLVVDGRNNRILAHAPPDKIAIIEEAVLILDVPSSQPSLLKNLNRVQTYRLATLDPEVVVKVLESSGNLEPETRLEVDAKNNTIIAYASLVDQLTIRTLVEKSDGSQRRFKVVKLKHLQADYVAGTIQAMMSPEEDKNSRRRWWSSSRDDDDQNKDKFRVEGDVEFNRLLVWANDIELAEVENLLVALGEISPRHGDQSTLRVIDTASEEDIEQILDRVRRAWPAFGPNRLLIEPPEQQQPSERLRDKTRNERPLDQTPEPAGTPTRADGRDVTEPESPRQSPEVRDVRPEAVPAAVKSALVQFADWRNQVAQIDAGRAPADPAEPGGGGTGAKFPPGGGDDVDVFGRKGPRSDETDGREWPPISISRGAHGQLIIGSEDTQALDQLEELMRRIAPPPKQYEVFTLRYASAYWISYTLEDFFEEEEKNTNNDRYGWWWWDYSDDSSNDTGARLSKRRPLKFIAEEDSNTILVQGADPNQLRTIRELIEFYDRPAPANADMARKAKIFYLQYAKAPMVAEVIKDVFRDLLSSNDKALQKHNESMQKSRPESRYTYIYGGDGSDQRTQVTFKGKLSVGVDEVSNTLVVSAQDNLLAVIEQIVDQLDKAAMPEVPTFQVLRVDSSTNVNALQQQLMELIRRPAKPSENGVTVRSSENGEQNSEIKNNADSARFDQ